MTDYAVMLAHKFDEHGHKIRYPCSVSPKLDGIRGAFRKGTTLDEGGVTEDYHFYSRNRKRWNDNVVAHILEPMRTAFHPDDDVVLDGEFFARGWPCQRINGAVAVRRLEPIDDTLLIRFEIFDVAGKYANQPYLERLKIIRGFVYPNDLDGNPVAREISTYQVDTPEQLMQYHQDFLAASYEGTMVRNLDAPYEYKRSYNLLKLKDFSDMEVQCVGFKEGKETDKGSRLVGTLGAVACQLPNGKSVDVGSGWSDEQRREIWNNQDKYLNQLLTIRYFELTPDGIPRFPVGVDWRSYE